MDKKWKCKHDLTRFGVVKVELIGKEKLTSNI